MSLESTSFKYYGNVGVGVFGVVQLWGREVLTCLRRLERNNHVWISSRILRQLGKVVEEMSSKFLNSCAKDVFEGAGGVQ